MTATETEVAGLRAERARLRRSALEQIREGIGYLEALRLVIVGGRDGDLLAFDWPQLQCDLQRLAQLERRLGPIEVEPLTEQQADALCKQVTARR